MSGREPSTILITCEHGGNEVPPEYAWLFTSPGAKAALQSHRGYDPGSLVAAEFFAAHFGVTAICSTTTRLLVDLNRSLDNDQLLSQYSRGLDGPAKERLLSALYQPYRQAVVERIRQAIGSRASESQGRVVHLSMHTFTTRFRGTRRTVDVGILFDPSRPGERRIGESWCQSIRHAQPGLRVQPNQPYLGTADGLTTWLRTQFPGEAYVGIEVEIANGFAKRTRAGQRKLLTAMVTGLAALLPLHRCGI